MALWPLLLVGTGLAVALRPRRRHGRRHRAGLDPAADFRTAVKRLAAVLRIPPPRVLSSPGLRNAVSDGVNIRIDFDWLRERIRACCNEPAAAKQMLIVLAAHELGHHILHWCRASGTSRDPGFWTFRLVRSRARELEADFVAGWVAAKLGVGDDGYRLFLMEAAQICSTHPTWPSRWAALTAGARSVDMELSDALALHERWFEHEASHCRPA